MQSAYCAGKHAIVGFTDSLRCGLLHDGCNVRVTVVHMPAMNTPQFDWVKSRLPRKPQPVPPIYQPEVGARAVYWAAHHHPRELLVGWPTVQAEWGQKFIPCFLDRYLARTAYDAQQYDGPADPYRPNNLWQPVPGSYGAHGDFDARSGDGSSALWAREHVSQLALGLTALAGLAYLASKGTWRAVSGQRTPSAPRSTRTPIQLLAIGRSTRRAG